MPRQEEILYIHEQSELGTTLKFESALPSFSSFSIFSMYSSFSSFNSFFTPTPLSFSSKLPHFPQCIFFFFALVPQDINIPCDSSPIQGVPLPLSTAKNERKNETSSFPAVSFASLSSSLTLAHNSLITLVFRFNPFNRPCVSVNCSSTSS